MKYNSKSLDYALDYILPSIKKAKEKGMNFNKPELIKMAAWRYFIANEGHKVMNNLYYSIIREAAIELEQNGEFVFGNMELENFK